MRQLRSRLDSLSDRRGVAAVAAAIFWVAAYGAGEAVYYLVANTVFKRPITNYDVESTVFLALVFGVGTYIFWKPESRTRSARLASPAYPAAIWPPAPALVFTALCIMIAALILGYLFAIMLWH